VLVLASSQHGAVGIIRSLGREGIPVYGVHENVWEPAARSRYLRGVFRWDFSRAPAADSVSFLLDCATKIWTRPVLVVTSDENALFLAENAAALAEAYTLATPPAGVVNSFFNKKKMYDLCVRHGIRAPLTALPASRGELWVFVQAAGFPLEVKGEYDKFLVEPGRKARVAIVTGEKELLRIFALNETLGAPALLLQSYNINKHQSAEATLWRNPERRKPWTRKKRKRSDKKVVSITRNPPLVPVRNRPIAVRA
jgi:D-aspartate ligase